MRNQNENQTGDNAVVIEKLKHFLQASPEEAEQILETQSEFILSEEALELMRDRLALLEHARQHKTQAQGQSLETELLEQQPEPLSSPERAPEQPPTFLDGQDIGRMVQQMTPEHWEQIMSEMLQISPEHFDMFLQMLQTQMGLSPEQTEQLRLSAGSLRQLDPEKLNETIGQISQLPSEVLNQYGQIAALSFNAQNLQKNLPSSPPLQAQGLPDSSQLLIQQELLKLPTSKQQRVLVVLNESMRPPQQQSSQQRLSVYTDLLKELAGTSTPYLQAVFHLERARISLQIIESNPRALVESGLADCNTALNTLTRTETPTSWAQAYVLRGVLYSHRQNGRRADNLKLALADFDSVLRHFSYETLPGLWVMARGMRGITLQELLKDGYPERSEQAIIDIEAALEHLSYQETPELWAALKAAATEAYLRNYLSAGNSTRTLEQVIQDCDDALKVATRERLPREWALLHQMRGLAFTDRNAGDARHNREQAIADCKDALTVFTRERAPYDWAATHMYLGNAYLSRVADSRTHNLKEALQHYNCALQVFTHEVYPQEWAKTVANLNLANQELGSNDRQPTQEQALTNFAAALEQLDPQKEPLSWATIHINWGSSYLNRLQGQRQANMEQAIEHYNQALTVLTPQMNPTFWAATLINRAMARRAALPQNLLNLVQSGGGTLQALFSLPLHETMADIATLRRRFDDAIADLKAALTVLTREETPREWAQAHRELATTYELYIWGDRQEYLAKGREHFAAAESVFSRTSTPHEWAVLRMNQGLGLFSHLSGDAEQEAQVVLDHFDAALTIFTPKVAPAHHRRTQLARALILERLERWSDAHQALLRAREVQRDLVTTALSEQSQNETIAEITYTNMYVHDAQVLLRMNPPDPVEAVISLEEGRAQNMRAMLEIDNYARKKQHILDPEARKRLDAFLVARNNWRACQHQSTEPLPDNLSASEKYQRQQQHVQALEAAYTEFVRTRTAIRQKDDSDFMTPLPTLNGIARALSGPDEALVYLTTGFYLSPGLQPITPGKIVDGSEASIALIVTQQVNGTPEVLALSLTEMTTNAIDMLLRPIPHENPEAGKEATSDTGAPLSIDLEKAIQTLGTFGLNELATTLYARGVRKLLVVPYGRLGLFPLSSVRVQIPERPACYLGELFEFASVPSARAAEIARERARACAKKRQVFLIGGNPQPLAKDRHLEDLPFATAEADTVYRLARKAGYAQAQLYHIAPREMTKSTLVTRLQATTSAHLALHSIYNVATPRNSMLILAGPPDMPEEKRTIALGEILDGKIDLQNLRLLVLSACETSLFDIQRLPNEVIGLAAGFLQAGVAGVIASLWKVNDEATYLLMTRFARLYLDSQGLWSPAQALAQAQRWLREEATNTLLQEYDPLLPDVYVEPDQALSHEKYSHQAALAYIREKAAMRARRRPDELPYSHPAFWAGFIFTGCY